MYNKDVHSIYHTRKALSMKKNNTKPTNAQTENTADDLRKSMDAAARFFERFGVVKLLGECGAYKEKGVPVRVILLYIFNLMFSPMSMYYQIMRIFPRIRFIVSWKISI